METCDVLLDCQAGTPVNCSGAGDQCNDGYCDEGGDQCVAIPKVDGLACDDEDACLIGETCQSGVCTGGVTPDCSGTGDQCNADNTCDPAGAEGNCDIPGVYINNGLPCDDGNVCLIDETCQWGVCTGGVPPVLCSYLGDQCNMASCDPAGAEGNCDVLTPRIDGTSCSDGLFCNGAEICVSGVCTPGTPVDCDDGTECTVDTCVEDVGGTGHCENPNLPIDTPCGDPTANDCTLPDTCDGAGVCLLNHGANGIPCTDDGNECTQDFCSSGACTHSNLPFGTLCGLWRDCPADACNAFFAEFYPDDGNDYCDGAGVCVAYSCSMEASYCTDNDNTDGVNGLTCGAECDQDSDCYDTDCDNLDGCDAGTYKDYHDMTNNCLLAGDCSCESNVCTDYTEIITDGDGDGYDTECDSDCDDTNLNVYPGAPELCDGLDNDCDELIDEGGVCDQDGDGYTEAGGDCNDSDPTVYPGATEVCNGLDNDCDGYVDEGCVEIDVNFTEKTKTGTSWSGKFVTNPVPGQVVFAYYKSCAEAQIGSSWSDFTKHAYTDKQNEMRLIEENCELVAGCLTGEDGQCKLNVPEGQDYIVFSEFESWSCLAKFMNRPEFSNWQERREWLRTSCKDSGELHYAIYKYVVTAELGASVRFAVYKTRWGAYHPIKHLGTIFGSVLDISATEYLVRVPDGESFDSELDPNGEVRYVYPIVLESDADWEVAINTDPPEGYECVTPNEQMEISPDSPQLAIIAYKPITG